jgi:hypothetical protein
MSDKLDMLDKKMKLILPHTEQSSGTLVIGSQKVSFGNHTLHLNRPHLLSMMS